MQDFNMDTFTRSLEEYLAKLQLNKLQKESYSQEDKVFSIDKMLNKMRMDTEDDWDVVIVCTGYEGTGKSTLVMELCRKAKEMFGYNYSFPKTSFEMMKAISDPDIKMIVFDEAINEAYARKSMSNENVLLNQVFTMSRNMNKIIIMIIPRINNIDVYFRRDRGYMWLHVLYRNTETREGEALLFYRNEINIVASDPFYIYEIGLVLNGFPVNILNSHIVNLMKEKLFWYIPSYIGSIKYTVSQETLVETRKVSDALKQMKRDNNEMIAKIQQVRANLKFANLHGSTVDSITKRLKKILPANDPRLTTEWYYGEKGIAVLMQCAQQLREIELRMAIGDLDPFVIEEARTLINRVKKRKQNKINSYIGQ